MSPTTINSYVQRFSSLLNWAVKEDYLDRNPARGLRMVDPVRKKNKRLPFNTEQLNLIFNAPIYSGAKTTRVVTLKWALHHPLRCFERPRMHSS